MATQRFNYNDKFRLNGKKVGISSASPEENLDVASGTLKGVDLQSNSGITTFSTYEGFLNKKTTYTENVQIDTGVSGSLSGEIVVGAGLTVTVGTAATSGQGDVECLKVFNVFNPPCGGTANRPSAATPGTLYYNKDFKTIEYWDGNFWRQVDNTTRSGRAVTFGGMNSPNAAAYKTIDTVNIHTKGNAIDFGEMIVTSRNNGSLGSAIRAFSAGGFNPSTLDDIDYIAIASGGTCADFGELSTNRAPYNGAASSSTRGIFAGGYTPGGTNVNTISYISIPTLGNALDFGDLTRTNAAYGASAASPTRGVFIAGGKWPAGTNVIDYVEIPTTGNATDFGDCIDSKVPLGAMGVSNGHGGL